MSLSIRPLHALLPTATRLALLAFCIVSMLAAAGAIAASAPVSTSSEESVAPPASGAAATGRANSGAPGGLLGKLGSVGSLAEEESFYGDSRDRVTLRVHLGRTEVLPGGDLPMVVVLEIAPAWHIWPDPRPFSGTASTLAVFDTAIRTTLSFPKVSPGVIVHQGFVEWPQIVGAPMNLGDGLKQYGVFEGRGIISIPITLAADAQPGPASITAALDFQACDDSGCMAPATVEMTIPLTIAPLGAALASQPLGPDFSAFPSDVFARIRGGEKAPSLVPLRFFRWSVTLNAASGSGYALLLVAAALGGLLLNFTPCVLPVIPLKIMGLSSAAGSRRRCLTLGLAMAGGVVAFWTGLGLAMATVSGFTSTSQLFTHPMITIAIGLFIAVMAVGMCGLFSVGLPQWVHSINPQHESHTGSFFFGIMTAVLSTPCTAPLMGAAAAWAATQAPQTTMNVFATIGLGMALPYMVLSAFPHLVAKMPRTGPASELIKQVMGLLLLAAAAYFVGAGLSGLMVVAPDPPNRTYWWVVAAFGVAAGAWLAWRTFRITPSTARRALFIPLGLVVVAISFSIGRTGTGDGPIRWEYYTPERFAQAQSAGHAILLDFTAEWCANCKTLEALVLNSDSVAGRLGAEHGIVPIKVDLTGSNPDGIAKRDSLGFRSIPLLAVFAPDGTEIFKSEAYTPAQVVEAIEKATTAAGRRVAVAEGGAAGASMQRSE
jgi:thiol:disulfide interchange protein DsbD